MVCLRCGMVLPVGSVGQCPCGAYLTGGGPNTQPAADDLWEWQDPFATHATSPSPYPAEAPLTPPPPPASIRHQPVKIPAQPARRIMMLLGIACILGISIALSGESHYLVAQGQFLPWHAAAPQIQPITVHTSTPPVTGPTPAPTASDTHSNGATQTQLTLPKPVASSPATPQTRAPAKQRAGGATQKQSHPAQGNHAHQHHGDQPVNGNQGQIQSHKHHGDGH